MNWAVAAPILVAIIAGGFALLQARRADKSAQFTTSMATVTGTLVDQLQEERQELKKEVAECKGRCAEMERKVQALSRQVEDMQQTIRQQDTALDEKDATIIRLKRQVGEPL